VELVTGSFGVCASGADNVFASTGASANGCPGLIAGISCKVGATPALDDDFFPPCFALRFDCFFLVKGDGSDRLISRIQLCHPQTEILTCGRLISSGVAP